MREKLSIFLVVTSCSTVDPHLPEPYYLCLNTVDLRVLWICQSSDVQNIMFSFERIIFKNLIHTKNPLNLIKLLFG